MPNERVVELVEFEATDPAMQGEMTITIRLADVGGGKSRPCTIVFRPASRRHNEAGWRISLARLAVLVELK